MKLSYVISQIDDTELMVADEENQALWVLDRKGWIIEDSRTVWAEQPRGLASELQRP